MVSMGNTKTRLKRSRVESDYQEKYLYQKLIIEKLFLKKRTRYSLSTKIFRRI
jgi:hypothetical protein